MGITKVKAARRIALVGVLAIAMALSMALTSCSSLAEEVIRQAITEEFDSIKNFEGAAVDDMVTEFSKGSDLALMGIDDREFVQAWLAGFDYSIEDVTVEGDIATVKATLVRKSLNDANKAFQADFVAVAEAEAAAGATQDELMLTAGEMLMKALNDTKPTSTSLDFQYVKKGNTWEPTNESTAALGAALAGI
ncbi:MAG: hypothetical protein FWG24_04255 [Eggerthellaceae bacterium]|nr:hypothetical protein [Eggerthellaceae bacterium]